MSDEIIATGSGWTDGEKVMLARIAQLVIGDDPEGVMPSVTEGNILNCIYARSRDFERPVVRGLGRLEERIDQDLSLMDDETLAAMLEGDPVLRSMLRAMMQVSAQCYYEDPRVLTLLGFEARPPFPAGHELPEGDWSLLEPVKAMANPRHSGNDTT